MGAVLRPEEQQGQQQGVAVGLDDAVEADREGARAQQLSDGGEGVQQVDAVAVLLLRRRAEQQEEGTHHFLTARTQAAWGACSSGCLGERSRQAATKSDRLTPLWRARSRPHRAPAPRPPPQRMHSVLHSRIRSHHPSSRQSLAHRRRTPTGCR